METLPSNPAPSSPVRPTRRELAAAARRLSEDLALVRMLAQKAAYGDGLTPEIRTVLAEGCLERVVKLVGFFYGGSRLTAELFVTDPERWALARPPMPAVFRAHLDEMTQLVSSDRWLLSDCRRAFGCWPFSSFASELERLMAVMHGHLSSEVAGWFGSRRTSPALH